MSCLDIISDYGDRVPPVIFMFMFMFMFMSMSWHAMQVSGGSCNRYDRVVME